MARKSKITVVQHIDGDEYIFDCPNCGTEISCGSWEYTVICEKCGKTIKIVGKQIYAEVEE